MVLSVYFTECTLMSSLIYDSGRDYTSKSSAFVASSVTFSFTALFEES